MLGLMQQHPLLLSSIIAHAARHHGTAEVVSKLPDGSLHLTGLVARPDGSFLLKRSLTGPAADAVRLGTELGDSLRADSPADLFA